MLFHHNEWSGFGGGGPKCKINAGNRRANGRAEARRLQLLRSAKKPGGSASTTPRGQRRSWTKTAACAPAGTPAPACAMRFAVAASTSDHSWWLRSKSPGPKRKENRVTGGRSAAEAH